MARSRPVRSERTHLDWSGRDGVNHWLGGRGLPCRICGRLTWLCDEAQQPCHKVCADAEQAQMRTSATTRKVA